MKNLSDEKKCAICLGLVIVMGIMLFYTYTGGSAANEHEGIIRLHVIADSNRAKDQALKLKVRDAVIEYMEKQDDLDDADETREYLKNNLDRFETIANGVIASEGYDYTASADLGVRYIPQKTYGDITFPAGSYEALNITLGSGRGENWWCVLFPPLCLLEEGTDKEELPDEDVADEDTVGKDTAGKDASDDKSEEQRMKLRWKTMELLSE